MRAATWYGDGLRWIGSLFIGAADYFERPAAETATSPLPVDDFMSDVRIRIMTRYY